MLQAKYIIQALHTIPKLINTAWPFQAKYVMENYYIHCLDKVYNLDFLYKDAIKELHFLLIFLFINTSWHIILQEHLRNPCPVSRDCCVATVLTLLCLAKCHQCRIVSSIFNLQFSSDLDVFIFKWKLIKFEREWWQEIFQNYFNFFFNNEVDFFIIKSAIFEGFKFIKKGLKSVQELSGNNFQWVAEKKCIMVQAN